MSPDTNKQLQTVEEAPEQIVQTAPAIEQDNEAAHKNASEFFTNKYQKGWDRICKLLSIDSHQTTLSDEQKRKCQTLLNVLKNIGDPQLIDSLKITRKLDQQIADAKAVFKENCELLNNALKPLKTVWTSVREVEQRSQSTLDNMTFLLLDPKELDTESYRDEIFNIVQDELHARNNKPEKFEAYTYVLVPNFNETPLEGACKFVEALLSDIMNNKNRVFSYFVHTDLAGDTPKKVLEGHKFNTSEEKYKYAIFSGLYAMKGNYGKIEDIQLSIAEDSDLRIPPSMMLHGYLVNNAFDVNEAPFGETNFEDNHTDIETQEYFKKYHRHVSDEEIEKFSERKVSFSRIKHTPQSGNMYVYIENTYNGWTAKNAANFGDVKVDMYIKRTLSEFIHRNIKGLKINQGSDKLRQAIDVFFEDLKKRKVIADLLLLDVDIPDNNSGNAADTLRIRYDVKVEGQVNATIISKTNGQNRETLLEQ